MGQALQPPPGRSPGPSVPGEAGRGAPGTGRTPIEERAATPIGPGGRRRCGGHRGRRAVATERGAGDRAAAARRHGSPGRERPDLGVRAPQGDRPAPSAGGSPRPGCRPARSTPVRSPKPTSSPCRSPPPGTCAPWASSAGRGPGHCRRTCAASSGGDRTARGCRATPGSTTPPSRWPGCSGCGCWPAASSRCGAGTPTGPAPAACSARSSAWSPSPTAPAPPSSTSASSRRGSTTPCSWRPGCCSRRASHGHPRPTTGSACRSPTRAGPSVPRCCSTSSTGPVTSAPTTASWTCPSVPSAPSGALP